MRSSINEIHKLLFRIRFSFCLKTQCKPPLSQPLSFPTVFADFQAAFLQQNVSILRNTIVYGDIKIYHSNEKRFLEKLRPASAMVFALQLGNQETDRFHFFTVAQLNIHIPISALISIFIKCVMCRVFAQPVTYIYSL